MSSPRGLCRMSLKTTSDTKEIKEKGQTIQLLRSLDIMILHPDTELPFLLRFSKKLKIFVCQKVFLENIKHHQILQRRTTLSSRKSLCRR